MHFSWQAQDISDFAKASHNLQAQLAVFGASCIICGRRRTRPTLQSFFVAGAVREHSRCSTRAKS